MDMIYSFIKRGEGRINLRALLQSFSALNNYQELNGFIRFEEIQNSFLISNNLFSPLELELHCGLMLKSLQPVLTDDCNIGLQIREDIIRDSVKFINHTLSVLVSKTGLQHFPIIEDFKRSVALYVTTKSTQDRCLSSFIPIKHGISGRPGTTLRLDSGSQGMIRTENKCSIHQNFKQNVTLSYTSPKTSVEQCEPVVKLLAQLRKQGMDVLFPQSTQDKVLACIYAAVLATKSPAHSELIHQVMAVKDSGRVTQLDNVSKTKVRGVLALLKHGEMLDTHGAEGLPVELILAAGMHSFEKLREKHDHFVFTFAAQNHIHIPLEIWKEIIWTKGESSKRLIALQSFISEVQEFYQKRLKLDLNCISMLSLTEKTVTHPSAPQDSNVNSYGHDNIHNEYNHFLKSCVVDPIDIKEKITQQHLSTHLLSEDFVGTRSTNCQFHDPNHYYSPSPPVYMDTRYQNQFHPQSVHMPQHQRYFQSMASQPPVTRHQPYHSPETSRPHYFISIPEDDEATNCEKKCDHYDLKWNLSSFPQNRSPLKGSKGKGLWSPSVYVPTDSLLSLGPDNYFGSRLPRTPKPMKSKHPFSPEATDVHKRSSLHSPTHIFSPKSKKIISVFHDTLHDSYDNSTDNDDSFDSAYSSHPITPDDPQSFHTLTPKKSMRIPKSPNPCSVFFKYPIVELESEISPMNDYVTNNIDIEEIFAEISVSTKSSDSQVVRKTAFDNIIHSPKHDSDNKSFEDQFASSYSRLPSLISKQSQENLEAMVDELLFSPPKLSGRSRIFKFL